MKQQLQNKKQPARETWVLVAEAMRLSGLRPSQIYSLVKKRVLQVRHHQTLKWHGHTQRKLYAVSELLAARKEWQKELNRVW